MPRFSRQAKQMGFRKPVGAAKIKKIVRKEIDKQEEFKLIDVSADSTLDNVGQITHLTPIAQGLDQSDRTGNKVKLRSILFRYNGTGIVAAGTAGVRCIIFQDRQHDGTTPTMANLLDGAFTSSPLDRDQLGRFKILHDEMIPFDIYGQGLKRMGKVYRKLNITCSFTSNLGTATFQNPLYIMWLSDQAANNPVIRWDTRVRFTDA